MLGLALGPQQNMLDDMQTFGLETEMNLEAPQGICRVYRAFLVRIGG